MDGADPDTWAITHCSPRCISREMDQQESSQKRNPLYHGANPYTSSTPRFPASPNTWVIEGVGALHARKLFLGFLQSSFFLLSSRKYPKEQGGRELGSRDRKAIGDKDLVAEAGIGIWECRRGGEGGVGCS